MKVVPNICDKELGEEMKPFNENETTSKFLLKTSKSYSLLEKFFQNLKRETVYRYRLELYYLAFFTTLLWNQRLIVHILFTFKHSINQ